MTCPARARVVVGPTMAVRLNVSGLSRVDRCCGQAMMDPRASFSKSCFVQEHAFLPRAYDASIDCLVITASSLAFRRLARGQAEAGSSRSKSTPGRVRITQVIRAILLARATVTLLPYILSSRPLSRVPSLSRLRSRCVTQERAPWTRSRRTWRFPRLLIPSKVAGAAELAPIADPGHLLQELNLFALRKSCRRIGERFRAFSVKCLHLLPHKCKPFELARNLGLQKSTERPPVTSPRCVQLFAPGTAEKPLDSANAMKCQERADPVHMACSFADKARPLPADPPGILGFGCRDRHRPEYALVSVEIGAQLEGHGFGVNAVGLRSTASARHQETGRIEDVDVDAALLQEARQPEAVIAALVADPQLHPGGVLALQLVPDSLEKSKQSLRVASGNCLDCNFRTLRRQDSNHPSRTGKFDGNGADKTGRCSSICHCGLHHWRRPKAYALGNRTRIASTMRFNPTARSATNPRSNWQSGQRLMAHPDRADPRRRPAGWSKLG